MPIILAIVDAPFNLYRFSKNEDYFAELNDQDKLLEEARNAANNYKKYRRAEDKRKAEEALAKGNELLNANIWYAFGSGYNGSVSDDGSKLTTMIVSKSIVGKQAKVDYAR